jgi:predicted nucleic acid-binding protein
VIVLDTNVVSELMDLNCDSRVETWLNSVDPASMWLTAILVFEVKGGIDKMDGGRRKQRLLDAFVSFVEMGFQDRVLPFDQAAALAAARIGAERKRRGRPVDIKDTLIAGIAVGRDAAIATRNVRHFEDLQVDVINPWNAPA